MILRLDDLDDFNENQVKVLNALFIVDEIFTGELKWYKLTDSGYVLLRSKSNKKKSDIAERKSDEQLDTTDMPNLESEEFAEQNKQQKGQELTILTPNQMLSRLPISWVQLKAGNNSKKLKNKFRQLLYSLYESKNLQKNSTKVWSTLLKTWKQFLWTAKTVKQANHTDLNWI